VSAAAWSDAVENTANSNATSTMETEKRLRVDIQPPLFNEPFGSELRSSFFIWTTEDLSRNSMAVSRARLFIAGQLLPQSE
jgi:hypothetical protein